MRQTDGEIVAFSDANATWSPDALRQLVRAFADPDVAYVCGQLRILQADGSNREGLYWRYEMGVRGAESRLGSVTGGNGSIYAVRRSDYVEVDPRFGHDLSLPYLMVQRGRRAVYEPAAHALEKPTPVERDRVPPQGAHVRALLADRAARQDAAPARAAVRARDRLAPAAALRLAACCTSSCSRPRSPSRRTASSTPSCSPRSSRSSPRPLLGVGIARYYVARHAGRRSSRSGTTFAAACPRRGRSRRERAEPRARRRDRRHGARRSRARCSRSARWR